MRQWWHDFLVGFFIMALTIALLGCASVQRQCPLAAEQELERSGKVVLWCER